MSFRKMLANTCQEEYEATEEVCQQAADSMRVLQSAASSLGGY